MRYEARDDGELLGLAQAGWAPAFAVLVHRHAPALLTAFADEPDPVERTVDVFLRALRRLPERDVTAPVEAWLFELTGRPVPEAVRPPAEAAVDHVWRDVSTRWPDGRRPRRRHPVLRGAAIAVGAVALGIAVPTVVLGLPPAAHDGEVETLRAQPLEEPPPEEPEPEELPEFEFPDVAEGPAVDVQDAVVADVEEPAPADPVTPAVPVAPSPAPPPADGGTTDGTVEPEPEPSPEPTVEPTPTPPPPPPPPPDDGTGDDGAAGGGGA